jgi:CheY-like chemotaxis protein
MTDKIKVLFVDDQKLILQGIKRMLREKRHKWDIEYVESGIEALAHMRKNGADVIVSDMRMPGMDGAALLKLIRKQNPETVRMILSGFSEKQNLLESARYIHQYLSKPISSEEVISVIDESMDKLSQVKDPYLRKLVVEAERLPVNQELFNSLQILITEDDWCLDTAAEIIWQDPAMTLMILKLVNTSFFGIGEATFSVKRATSELGKDTLATLIRNSGLGLVGPEGLEESKQEKYHIYWTKALNTAKLAHHIACHLGKTEKMRNEVYTAALLHNIGTLLSLHSNEVDIQEEDIEMAGFILLDIWGIPGQEQRNIAKKHELAKDTIYELISKAEYLNRLLNLDEQEITNLDEMDQNLVNKLKSELFNEFSGTPPRNDHA